MNEERDKKPMRLTDKKGIIGPAGDVYELDFSRESALYAVDKGIDVAEENLSVRLKFMPELFYCAFRKGYKKIPRDKIDRLREDNGGVPIEGVTYLYELLAQALTANVVKLGENEKNGPAMDLEMDLD